MDLNGGEYQVLYDVKPPKVPQCLILSSTKIIALESTQFTVILVGKFSQVVEMGPSDDGLLRMAKHTLPMASLRDIVAG